jgi:hypothetical protein
MGFNVVTLRQMPAHACLFLLSLTLLGFSFNLSSDEHIKSVVFILSGDSPVYDRVASATEKFIREDCGDSQAECLDLVFVKKPTDKTLIEEFKGAFLTISLGTKATDWLGSLPFDGNQLYAMLPYRSRKNRTSPESETLAEIYIDQPYRRYFDLIRMAVPRAGRVGLLIHASDIESIDIIAESASQLDLTLKTSIVSNERNIGEALSSILNDIDVLLALPDSRIHNSHTISHILTTAYHNNIPVIGFSSAYVKAGAAAAIYTSPDDIARQLSDVVLEVIFNGHVNRRLQHATYFSVSVNFEVARSLGLAPISPSEVKQRMSKRVIK